MLEQCENHWKLENKVSICMVFCIISLSLALSTHFNSWHYRINNFPLTSSIHVCVWVFVCVGVLLLRVVYNDSQINPTANHSNKNIFFLLEKKIAKNFLSQFSFMNILISSTHSSLHYIVYTKRTPSRSILKG